MLGVQRVFARIVIKYCWLFDIQDPLPEFFLIIQFGSGKFNVFKSVFAGSIDQNCGFCTTIFLELQMHITIKFIVRGFTFGCMYL